MARLLSETEQAIEANSTPVIKPPWLFSFHGNGLMLRGAGLHHHDLGDRFVRVLWLVIVLIPIVPVGIYLVEKDHEQSNWRTRALIVHRRVKLKALLAIWGLPQIIWLIASAWLIAMGVFLAIVSFLTFGEWRGWWRL